MFYIVGLGNPGEKYAKTRHNVGRLTLESLASNAQADWSMHKPASAATARMMFGDAVCELVMPETFMNKSGETVKYFLDKEEAAIGQFIVVHDDIDLPFGDIKIVQGRGAGGNNGIKSVIQTTGSKDFIRVRVGIAPKSFWTGEMKRPAGGGPLERFVLKPFSGSEAKQLPGIYKQVHKAIEVVIEKGVEAAMNQCN
jgi:PTH1 family peptidyl-tRNA hydrolase